MRGANDAKPNTPSNRVISRFKPEAPESPVAEGVVPVLVPVPELESELEEVPFWQVTELILLVSLVKMRSAH